MTADVPAKGEGSKLGKAQGGEAKKGATSYERKKSSSPGHAEETMSPQAPSDHSQLIQVPNAQLNGDLVNSAEQEATPGLLTGIISAGIGDSDTAELGKLSAQPMPVVPGLVSTADNSFAEIADKSGFDTKQANVVPATAVVVPSAANPLAAPGAAASTAPILVEGATQPKATPSAERGAPSDIANKNDVPAPTDLPILVAANSQQLSNALDTNTSPMLSSPFDARLPASKAGGLAVGGAADAVSGKGKVASRRTSDVADEKQAATGDSDPLKAGVEPAAVSDKDAASATRILTQQPAVMQATSTEQLAGSIAIGQAPHGAAQNTSGAAGPATSAAASADNVQVAHAMSNAQLIQSAHGSEMRLGMQSAEFGNISISTLLSRQALSAQISIDHSALGHALAAHLPAIQEKLGSAYGVQAKVELRDTGTNSSLNDSSSRESKGNRQSRGGESTIVTTGLQGGPAVLTSSTYTSSAASALRLDIRI